LGRARQAVQVLEAVRKPGLAPIAPEEELITLHTKLGNTAAAKAIRRRIEELAGEPD